MAKLGINFSCILIAVGLFQSTAFAENATTVVGDAAAGQKKITVCVTCHAEDGNSVIAGNPTLAGQNQDYLIKALKEYQQAANGPRNNPIMAGMAAPLSEQDIADIAAYYAQQPRKVGEADPNLVKQGQALYRGGDIQRGIPACIGCHGPTGIGNAPGNIPALAGQNSAYIMAALKQYQSGARQNTMMQDIANRMNDADMQAVGSYIYGLYPTGMKLPEQTSPADNNAVKEQKNSANTKTE